MMQGKPVEQGDNNKMTDSQLIPKGGWQQPTQPRLPAPPVKERGLAFRGLSKASALFGRAQLPAIFPVFNINPRLFWSWLFFASRLMPYGRLPGKVREMLILRTAWNCRSRYEWGQHLELGQKAGLSDAEVVAITKGAAGFDGTNACLMQACDELCHDKLIADATWDALGAHYSRAELIEIMILVGHYEMVAGFLINAGIELEASIEEHLRAFHQRIS